MDLAKLSGLLTKTIVVEHSISDMPQFHKLRSIMLEVLDAHPAAKADFMLAMQKLQIAGPRNAPTPPLRRSRPRCSTRRRPAMLDVATTDPEIPGGSYRA